MHTPASRDDDDLTWLPAVEIAARIQAGTLSACDATEAFLARQTATHARYNAVVLPLHDQARAAARAVDTARHRGKPLGPLAGVPISIKDCFEMIGVPSTIGISTRRHIMGTDEGPVIQRLRQAGVVMVGKTNVPQGMLMYETDNRLFGRTPHPEREDRGCGGSSGGEAAAVAARLSAIGIGTDLLGSIRQPAHVCGIHGFKPTMQRVSLLGCVSPVRGLEAISAQPGPMARHMSDIIAMSRLLLAEPYDDVYTKTFPWREPSEIDIRKLRIGVWEEDEIFRPSPAVRRAVREAADALSALGADVVPFHMPEVETGFRLCLELLASGAAANIRRMMGGERPVPPVKLSLQAWEASPTTRKLVAAFYDRIGQKWRAKLVRWCRGCPTSEYWSEVQERREYVRRVTATWRKAGFDAILAPPHGLPALMPGTSPQAVPAGAYCFVFNLLGSASGVVAATRVRQDEETDRPRSKDQVEHMSRLNELGSVGLPVGVQVSSLPGEDSVCLAVMQALETHFATQPDYPPHSVPRPASTAVAPKHGG